MNLKCECVNSTADSLHGKGIRPHSKLQPTENGQPLGLPEYACDYCSYCRTKAKGMQTGVK